MRRQLARAVMVAVFGVLLPAAIGDQLDPFEDRPVMLWLKGWSVLGPVVVVKWAEQELRTDKEPSA